MKNEEVNGYRIFQSLGKTHKALSELGNRGTASLQLGSLAEFAMLEILLNSGPQPVNTIGKIVMLTSGSITAAVDRLEKRGWVKRKPGANDRRVVEVHLTASGKKVISEVWKKQEKTYDEVIDGLSANERNVLYNALQKINARAESAIEAAG